MKIISWNVNGLRAVLSKDINGIRLTSNPNVLDSIIEDINPDIIALQETKCPKDLNISELLHHSINYSYKIILESKTRKGYSGVSIFAKRAPLRVFEDFPENIEGRVLCVEYETCIIINAYVPNSKPDLSRLSYRETVWEPTMRAYIQEKQKIKPVVYMADMNVAPTELDIYTLKGKHKEAGFTLVERNAFTKMLDECNIIDAYRHIYPSERAYTWFSAISRGREKNNGWRIDTFLISCVLKDSIKTCKILNNYYGSDHVPILLELKSDEPNELI